MICTDAKRLRRKAYNTWYGMRRRCYEPTANAYEYYGARGIAVCRRWRDSFTAFLNDMGLPPSRLHSIDRIDNHGHYEPRNCQWVTRREQSRNMSSNRTVTFNGRTMVLADWANELGIDHSALRNRIKRHGVVVALSTPPLQRGKVISHPKHHKRHPSTGFRGVYRNKNRFEARVHRNGSVHYLGMFGTAEEASVAVCNFDSIHSTQEPISE